MQAKMDTVNRVIFDLFLLWAIAAIVLSAPAPAPHPWKRLSDDVRSRPRAVNGSPPPPPTRGGQGRAEPDRKRRTDKPPSPGVQLADPGAAPGLGHNQASNTNRRTRRHRRAKYRGCRGGVSWARHGDRRPNELLIGQLNIQSMKPKLADLRLDLSEFHHFDILALCETWITPNIPDRLLQIDGFKLHRADRAKHNKLPYGHGGVAILVRDTLEVERVPTPVTTAASSNLEIILCLVRTGKFKRVLIASVYRHPTNTQQQLTADFDDLEGQLQHMLTVHPDSTLMIAGDLNVCLLRKPTPPATSTPGDRLRLLVSTYGLHICNTTTPTYRPAATLLDVLITNRRDQVIRSGVTRCHYGGPHDFSRMVLRQSGRNASHRTVIQSRSLGRLDTESFNETLTYADWSPVFTETDPTTKWDAFLRVFTPLLDGAAPVRRVRLPAPGAPSLSSETRGLLASRRAALAAGPASRDRYRELNRQCRAAVRRDCRESLQRKLDEAGPNRTWQVLRPIIGTKKAAAAAPCVTADAINAYFVNVGPSTAASVPPPQSSVPLRLPRVPACGMRIGPVTLDDLCITVGSMKPSKSTGKDGVSVYMLQKFFPGLCYVLLDIVNASLVTGIVPPSWKHALVTPIPKGGELGRVSNWRPISILPAVTKVIERIVHHQISGYFTRNKLFSISQHGYRRHHSTETALTVITDRVYRAMDQGEICMLVCLDCSKCFDVINHAKLLSKLEAYGVDTHWLADYFSGHTQQVKINKKDGSSILSTTLQNTTGVYQGGSLSCLMFSIFANEMNLHTGDCTVIQYADDTQLLVCGKKERLREMVHQLETTLEKVVEWFCQNQMKINESKTQLLVLGTKAMLRNIPQVSINVGRSVVTESRIVKNLGLVIDRHLSFEPHIDQLTAKCTGMLIALMHARHVIPRCILRQVVEGLVMSSIRYCLSVYGTCGITQMHRVQKLVNFCTRVISGKRKYDRVSCEAERLGIMSARNLFEYHRLTLTKSILRFGEPETLRHMFEHVQHAQGTRQTGQLRLPRIKSDSGKRRLAYGGAKAFNVLPSYMHASNAEKPPTSHC